ncbi:MAG: NADH-quinone oxidoreductase subunit B [Candidatus Omnitrophota bacterium]|jgi:NADH-quinone oxidoreductase subunit B
MEVTPTDPMHESPSTEPGALAQFANTEVLFNYARSKSIWPMTFGLACCAIELMGTGTAKYDLDRFGHGVFRPSPRQSDVMIVSGTIARKMAPCIKTLYDQMPSPKYVIAHGGCATAGGPFKFPGQYAILEGIDKIIPVNVYIPGCPPRPEALITGILKLQDLIKKGQTKGSFAPAISQDFQSERPVIYKDAMTREDFRKDESVKAPNA